MTDIEMLAREQHELPQKLRKILMARFDISMVIFFISTKNLSRLLKAKNRNRDFPRHFPQYLFEMIEIAYKKISLHCLKPYHVPSIFFIIKCCV